MLYALIAVILVLLVFVVATFIMTHKNYKFELEGGVLRVQNVGSHLKLYFNDNLIKDVFSPQLYAGEKVDFKIGEKDLLLDCKCNNWGNKMSVKILDGENVVATNGIEIKK